MGLAELANVFTLYVRALIVCGFRSLMVLPVCIGMLTSSDASIFISTLRIQDAMRSTLSTFASW